MNDLIHRNGRRLILCIALIICSAVIPASTLAAEVNVYAEGAYTETDLVLHIYADITSGAILSFGVKVTYPATELTYSSATKNEAVWYMGDGTTNYPYMNPEDDGSNVVIIGGKLDTADPTAGVTGTRVLLGTVTFTHSGTTDFSGVTLTYGRGDGSGAYKNFVETDGTVKDGEVTGFSVEIYERGDANADGNITPADMIAIRNAYYGGASLPSETAADCNADGSITPADMICIRNKYYN
ncbi:MAG: dockerin type I domain-containing protein [Desulfobacteraceae bacterium]|jgi:hypothetical protein